MAQKQEVTQLRKALEKERCAVRSAQDEVVALREALDSERSAVKALRRDIVNQIKKVKEEEAEKYTILVEQLKQKSSLEQEEALKNQKENIRKAITIEFQRLQQTREAEMHKEATRKEEDLRHQLKDALNRLHELSNKITLSSQNTSLNAHTNTTPVTNPNKELQACRAQNKQLELRLQELTEAERRNADNVRTQYDEHLAREAELQKTSRRETKILLEKLKSKDRTIELLEKETRKLKGRLETSGRNFPDIEKPGEPPRLGIKKRLALKTNGLSSETARTRCDPIKETNSNDSTDQQSCCDNSNCNSKQETEKQDKGPTDENTDNNLKENENNSEQEDVKNVPVTITEEIEVPLTVSTPEAEIAINSWTKAVGLETLYQVVVAEHQELQRAHQALAAKLRAEQKARADLEASIQQNRSENPINLALAAQIQELTARQAELISENHELREQNDLLEFRLLEIDSAPSSLHFKTPSSPSRSPESRGDREVDDISDSGVLSLPTSEDISETDFHELAMEPCNRDIKSKLSYLCQTVENISDRISIQQGLALLRHYEARLEASLANMSPDPNKISNLPDITSITPESTKSQSRIIATVLPFTDLSQSNGKQKDELPIKKLLKDADCLQESGIFEESSESPEYCTRWTQTDWGPDTLQMLPPGGDLSLEIRKLKQIRERIEEQGGNKRLSRSPGVDDQCQNPDLKELLFYRDRVEILENKIAIYESSGDEQIRRLSARLEKEILLSAQIKHLKERCNALEELNRRLEEEKCEFEEAENDTRLRCQKLEVKLSALGEKKSNLQVQLQQNARTMANLRSCLAEEEKKRIEARQHAQQMEALVQCYEQRNFELEEKEMEAHCRVQMLEGTIPALMAYNSWKVSSTHTINQEHPYEPNNIPSIQGCCTSKQQPLPSLPPISEHTFNSTFVENGSILSDNKSCDSIERAQELFNSLKSLKSSITTEFEKMEQKNTVDQLLDDKINNLEHTFNSSTVENGSESSDKSNESLEKAQELFDSLKSLKTNITTEFEKIEKAHNVEQLLRDKIKHLECTIAEKDKEAEASLPPQMKQELCQQLESLRKENTELECKVKDLEMKEGYYKQTLQQADTMWSTMEQDYKDQIRNIECKLESKQKELQDAEALVRKLCSEKDERKRLQERVCSLESDIKDLNFKVANKEMENKHYEKEEKRLCSELASMTEELNHYKHCLEPGLRKQLEEQKKIIKELRKEIDALEKEREQDLEDRYAEVSGLKRKINNLSKEILENECTISELREEVQTLEIAVNELREKFLEEQDTKERMLIRMTSEIEDKDKEICLLKQKPSKKLPKSARQELEEAEEESHKSLHNNQANEKKYSRHQRKHKAKCKLTLKKLNEKIKAGLLVDENQFINIASSTSGDDSSCESLQNTLNFPSICSSSNELSENENFLSASFYDDDSTLDNKLKESLSNLEKSERLIDGNDDPSLRFPECKVKEDDPHVDLESTEVVTSSQTSQDKSFSHIEEYISEQKLLTPENDETTSSTQRLNSAIKHSTVKRRV